ncbi:MAG: small basic protein [Algisphaera sp.]
MSLDSSLKSGGGLSRHRNVLTRAERVAKLTKTDGFDMEKDNPLGIRKVGNRKVTTGKTAKKKTDDTEEEAAAPTA